MPCKPMLLLPNSQLREVMLVPLPPMRPLLPESTQPFLLKLKLRPRLKLKLKLLLVQVLEPLLPLLLMPLPILPHNILPKISSMEESQLMCSSKVQELNANLVRPLRFNIPVLSQLTVKCSTPQFQEVSQFHLLSEK